MTQTAKPRLRDQIGADDGSYIAGADNLKGRSLLSPMPPIPPQTWHKLP